MSHKKRKLEQFETIEPLPILGDLYLFVFYQGTLDDTKDVKNIGRVRESQAKIPEFYSSRPIEASLCKLSEDDFCYLNPEERPIRYFGISKVDPSFRKCSFPEMKQCASKKWAQVSIAAEHFWKPPTEALSTEWIAYLIDFKQTRIVAAANGTSSDIHLLEIHPDYRGRGLCTPFMTKIMQHYARLGWNSFHIFNAAEEIGARCYSKAAKAAHFDLTCQDWGIDKEARKFCRQMNFTRQKNTEKRV
jgi:hypothetical protein